MTPITMYVTIKRLRKRQSSLEESHLAASTQKSEITTTLRKTTQPVRYFPNELRNSSVVFWITNSTRSRPSKYQVMNASFPLGNRPFFSSQRRRFSRRERMRRRLNYRWNSAGEDGGSRIEAIRFQGRNRRKHRGWT